MFFFKKFTQVGQVICHRRNIQNITYDYFLSIPFLHNNVCHSFLYNHVVIWEYNGSLHWFIKPDEPFFIVRRVIDTPCVKVPKICFILSQICISHQIDLCWVSTSSMTKLWYTLVISILLFVKVIVPSIVAKLLIIIALEFLHLRLHFEFIIVRSIILVIGFLLAPSLLFHLFFYFSFPFLFFEECSFIFLKNLAYKACSNTISEFLNFSLNSRASRDAYNSMSFIYNKYLYSSIATNVIKFCRWGS